MDLKAFIRDVPDFPKPGIVFKDITPLLQNPQAFAQALEEMAQPYLGEKVDVVCAIESRGFIFGAPLAVKLQSAFVPIRKKGKLPWKTIGTSYSLEYGEEQIEMHQDAFLSSARVLMVDDVLATGGTLEACSRLVKSQGGEVVGLTVLVELAFLGGRQRLKDRLHSVILYDK